MQKTHGPRALFYLALSIVSLASNVGVRAEDAKTNAPLPVFKAKPGPPATLDATAADKAWIDFQRACRPPAQPDSWREKAPSREEQQKYFLPFVVAAADKAKDFYTKYPNEAMAPTAKMKEFEMLQLAVNFGSTNSAARLSALEQTMLADPKVDDETRFQIRKQMIEQAAASKEAGGLGAIMVELEKGVRELQKDFPKRPEVAEMLLQIAGNSEPEKARALLNEVIASNASADVKAVAQNSLKKMEMVGKPVAIKFKAVDDREVDLAKMTGKVVLVDFWATWCGPCMAELPEVKATYEKYHSKGFEIVGINLDAKKEALQDMTKAQKMEWPQYFDGLRWGNKIVREFGIESIPTMWLVDKKGNVRDLSARGNLGAKVEKLLAE